MSIIVNIVFILFYLQVEPVFLPACLNKAIQITSCVINIGNNSRYVKLCYCFNNVQNLYLFNVINNAIEQQR